MAMRLLDMWGKVGRIRFTRSSTSVLLFHDPLELLVDLRAHLNGVRD